MGRILSTRPEVLFQLLWRAFDPSNNRALLLGRNACAGMVPNVRRHALAPAHIMVSIHPVTLVGTEATMGQLGFFDADKRLQALSARGDPLEAIDRLVPWESFRAAMEAGVLTPDELKKSSAGRKPFDAILMFRMLVHSTICRTSRWNIR